MKELDHASSIPAPQEPRYDHVLPVMVCVLFAWSVILAISQFGMSRIHVAHHPEYVADGAATSNLQNCCTLGSTASSDRGRIRPLPRISQNTEHREQSGSDATTTPFIQKYASPTNVGQPATTHLPYQAANVPPIIYSRTALSGRPELPSAPNANICGNCEIRSPAPIADRGGSIEIMLPSPNADLLLSAPHADLGRSGEVRRPHQETTSTPAKNK